MARKSSIDRLPEALRALIARLREQGRTIDEIRAHLSALDAEVSRSALGRHVQAIDRIGEQIRRQRAMAEALVERFGDAPESRVARLNIELAHGVLTRLVVAEDGGEVTLDTREAAFVARAIKDLAGAEKIAGDTAKLRAQFAREAAAAAETAARAQGLSAETVQAIRAEILGVAA